MNNKSLRDAPIKVMAIAALVLAWSAVQATANQAIDHGNSFSTVPREELWIVFGFGLGFLIMRLVLAIRFPHPSNDQEAVFRTVLSLAAAGIAAAIPGLMRFESQVAATTISATGALAVFALVYLMNPASPRKEVLLLDKALEEPAAAEGVQPLLEGLDRLSAEMRVLASRVEQLELAGPKAEGAIVSLQGPRTGWIRRSPELRTQRVLLLVATAILIGLLYVVAFTNMSPVQGSLLRVVFALFGAGVGTLIPGTLSVATAGTRTILRALAALTLFLIIYFFAAMSVAAVAVSN